MADARAIIQRHKDLDAERSTLLSHWQEIADLMLPRRTFLTYSTVQGDKRTSKIYDGTAIWGLNILANGLYGHLTTPSAPWFQITVRDRDLMKLGDVAWWLQDTSERMHLALATSNFGSAIKEIYTDLGGFGTGCLYLEEGRRSPLAFSAFSPGTICVDEGADGRIDTVYRQDRYTAKKILEKWPEAEAKEVRKAVEQGKPGEAFDVIHAYWPRGAREPGKIDRLNKPYASVYVLVRGEEVLEEGGYDEEAYFVPRWDKDSNEKYGRSPGMDALPDTKMLNQMSKDNIRAIQKMIDPPLLMQNENRMSRTSVVPGSIIYYQGEKPDALYFKGDYRIAVDAEEKRRQSILKCFYADLFLLLIDRPTGMTATEVRERVDEKLILLGPTLGRLQSELFDPMIRRAFWLLLRRGELAPVPQELMGANLDVVYVNRLAMAMKMFEFQGISNTMSFVGPILQVDPTVVDNFDLDEMVRGGAERLGMPSSVLRKRTEVEEIRARRAQAEAEAKAEQDLAQIGQQIPPGKAIEPNSPIDAALGGAISQRQGESA